MKIDTTIKIARLVFVFSFLIVCYLLLPYIFSLIGIKTFVVISDSLKHEPQNQVFFESFWKNLSVNPEKMPFRYGARAGDLIFFESTKNYSAGDVVVIKLPKTQNIIVHRIYKYNSTHFRDIGDLWISEENLRTVTLAVDDITISVVKNLEKLVIKPDMLYEGPYFEISSHYWMSVSYIEGKASFVLPGAGMLYVILEDVYAVEQA